MTLQELKLAVWDKYMVETNSDARAALATAYIALSDACDARYLADKLHVGSNLD